MQHQNEGFRPRCLRLLAICRWSVTVFASRLVRVAAGDANLPLTCHACAVADGDL